MCGIFGVVNRHKRQLDKRAFITLGCANDARGGDACGVMIDGKKTSKSRAKIKKIDKKSNTSIVELVIHEGRNHQVKKMFQAIGYDVIRLRRESFATLTVNDLKSGEYRELSVKEVKRLYALVKQP